MVYHTNYQSRFQETVVIWRSLLFWHGEWTVDGSATLNHYRINFSLVQYWTPPHWSCRELLVHNLLQHWISRTTDECWTLFNCPLRSTDVILWNYFVWGFIREEMFFSPMPLNLEDFRNVIALAMKSVDEGTVTRDCGRNSIIGLTSARDSRFIQWT